MERLSRAVEAASGFALGCLALHLLSLLLILFAAPERVAFLLWSLADWPAMLLMRGDLQMMSGGVLLVSVVVWSLIGFVIGAFWPLRLRGCGWHSKNEV